MSENTKSVTKAKLDGIKPMPLPNAQAEVTRVPNDKILVKIFAKDGDRVVIPDQSEEEVSYQKGYPESYEISPICGGKLIKRGEFNGIFYQNAIQQENLAGRMVLTANGINTIGGIVGYRWENWTNYLRTTSNATRAIVAGEIGDWGQLDFRITYKKKGDESQFFQMTFSCQINPNLEMKIKDFNYFNTFKDIEQVLKEPKLLGGADKKFFGMNYLRFFFAVQNNKLLFVNSRENGFDDVELSEVSINTMRYSRSLNDMYDSRLDYMWNQNDMIYIIREGGGSMVKALGEMLYLGVPAVTKERERFGLYNDGLLECALEKSINYFKPPLMKDFSVMPAMGDTKGAVLRQYGVSGTGGMLGYVAEPQLPNIKGSIGKTSGDSGIIQWSNVQLSNDGALSSILKGPTLKAEYGCCYKTISLDIDASKSNKIYSDEGDVRMKSINTKLFIRAY